MTQADVAIIGGGAAGISAARRLQALGRSALIVEALPRLGGRAHTVSIQGTHYDLGCGWLHSAERNPLVTLAESHGQQLDRSKGAWHSQLYNINFSADEQQAAWDAYDRFREHIHDHPPASDCAADALPAEDRWRPFIDGLSSFINGVDLSGLSVKDFLAYDDMASEANWRIPSGYGAFITGLGVQMPVALDTSVSTITEGADFTLETTRGTIRAQAVIVAVSSTVLGRGAIRFEPAVDDHLHAASRVPLGLANKVFLAVAEPDAVPPESHLLGCLDRAETASYYIRPFGRPVIECFLGGALAHGLEDAGDAAAVDFVVEGLRNLLGGDFARGLSPLAVTRWAHEPTIGGSYSHALPGHADARAVLARPANERFCFAGEACSAVDYSTVHGAWESGIAAADWIAQHTVPSS